LPALARRPLLRVTRLCVSPALARRPSFCAAHLHVSPTLLVSPALSRCLPLRIARSLVMPSVNFFIYLFKFFPLFKFFNVSKEAVFFNTETLKRKACPSPLLPRAATFPEDGPLKWSDLIKQIKEF
jgi:hypothetical protein